MGDCCKEEQDRKPCGDCIEQVGQTEGLLAMATVLSLGRSIAALPIGRLVRYFTLALPVRFNRGLSFASFPVVLMGGERRDDPTAKAGGDHPIAAKRENHDAQNHSDDLRNPDPLSHPAPEVIPVQSKVDARHHQGQRGREEMQRI